MTNTVKFAESNLFVFPIVFACIKKEMTWVRNYSFKMKIEISFTGGNKVKLIR